MRLASPERMLNVDVGVGNHRGGAAERKLRQAGGGGEGKNSGRECAGPHQSDRQTSMSEWQIERQCGSGGDENYEVVVVGGICAGVRQSERCARRAAGGKGRTRAGNALGLTRAIVKRQCRSGRDENYEDVAVGSLLEGSARECGRTHESKRRARRAGRELGPVMRLASPERTSNV
jgi:hypothetical protein